MKMELATYSFKAIFECIEALKTFSFDAKALSCIDGVNKVSALYDFLYEKTNCLIFDKDFDLYFDDFRKSVFEKTTKKEKAKKLRFVELHLKNNIKDIYIMMQNHEVNVVE